MFWCNYLKQTCSLWWATFFRIKFSLRRKFKNCLKSNKKLVGWFVWLSRVDGGKFGLFTGDGCIEHPKRSGRSMNIQYENAAGACVSLRG